MDNDDYWQTKAIWQERVEGPAELATRMLKLAAMLRSVDPIVSRWFHWETEELCVGIEESRRKLPGYIEEGVSRDEDGTADPDYGYHFRANNSAAEVADDRTFILRFFAGGRIGLNTLSINTPVGIPPVAALLNYRVFKGVVRAMAAAFEPDFVYVLPTALPSSIDFQTKSYSRNGVIPAGWMLYLDPSLAKQASPPPSFIQEPCPDGGLFLAVTHQTFDPRNIAHRRGTLEMEAMLDPLNGMTRKR